MCIPCLYGYSRRTLKFYFIYMEIQNIPEKYFFQIYTYKYCFIKIKEKIFALVFRIFQFLQLLHFFVSSSSLTIAADIIFLRSQNAYFILTASCLFRLKDEIMRA